MPGAQRLSRLAAAQAAMARAVEARLAERERVIANLIAARSEIETLSESATGSRAAFLPAALRSLIEADVQLAALRAEASTLRRQLIMARGREKVLDTKSSLLRSAEARKSGESEALETALAMAKDSGKPDVMK